MVRERPPMRAIFEDVAIHAAVAPDGKDRRPLIDGRSGVVRLHDLRSAERSPVELHDLGNASDAMPDEAREDPPFALGPVSEIAFLRAQEALGVATALSGTDRFAKHFDMLAGRHLQAAASKHSVELLGRHGCDSVWVGDLSDVIDASGDASEGVASARTRADSNSAMAPAHA